MIRTLYDKLWDAHIVRPETAHHPAILYVDLHMVHEVSSPQAFRLLMDRGLATVRPSRTIGVIDHSTPTLPRGPDGRRRFVTPMAELQTELLVENCRQHGIAHHGWDSPQRGIVHVMVPELGLTRPGLTIVCGDSHSSTHGAFGCLAFGIGTTEVAHVLATQCLFQRKMKNMAVEVAGQLPRRVSGKDLILAIIAKTGTDGAAGHAIEYRGPAIRALSMEGRMTVCNMTIEAGARSGLIAPDHKTLSWLAGSRNPPSCEEMDDLAKMACSLASDDRAEFDKVVCLDASQIAPMVTFGTDPGTGIAITDPVPHPVTPTQRSALDYMGITPGKPLLGQRASTVFLGSCTNSRLSDLREAAEILRGRKIAEGVRFIVVAGSKQVMAAAQAEGLDQVFLDAGADWRPEPGCSMCIGMNGDEAPPTGLTVSTSNRNFVGRQGPNAKTILCGPSVAAATAVSGWIADPRLL